MQIYKFKHESCGKKLREAELKAVGPLLKALFEVCCEIITELWKALPTAATRNCNYYITIMNEHSSRDSKSISQSAISLMDLVNQK